MTFGSDVRRKGNFEIAFKLKFLLLRCEKFQIIARISRCSQVAGLLISDYGYSHNLNGGLVSPLFCFADF